MTDDYDDMRQERGDVSQDTPRRRSTDMPQPLDYPTRELVRDIVDGEPAGKLPQVSFLRRLLGMGRKAEEGPA